MQDNLINKLNAFTVLYIEDEEVIRRNIQELLEHFFKETFTATNAREGYLKYIQEKPDLIITDIQLDGETGIDLIKKIRASNSKIRVIITSADTDLEYMLEAAELHLVKFIIKPITQDKLMNALDSFIKSHDDSKIYTIDVKLIFDFNKSLVSNEEEEFYLTKKESLFLKLLITKNRIITYEEIENLIWNNKSLMTSNAMRLFIKNFRKKLPQKMLKNIQGTGYRLITKKIDNQSL